MGCQPALMNHLPGLMIRKNALVWNPCLRIHTCVVGLDKPKKGSYFPVLFSINRLVPFNLEEHDKEYNFTLL